MRVAVISDIHGNLLALNAVLEALGPVDAIWQLGDIVGYGPQPDEVVARLMEIGATGVRGNHDAAAIGELATDTFNEDARAAVEWTGERITTVTRDWLRALPQRHVEGDFTLAHGSPRDPVWEYMVSPAVARANLAHIQTRHCLVGHTHLPLVFRQAGERMETIMPEDGDSLTLDERRAVLNPGSVGQPRDGDPRACGMTLDTETGEVTWRRVVYPIAEVQALMAAVDLPPRLIERLAFGW